MIRQTKERNEGSNEYISLMEMLMRNNTTTICFDKFGRRIRPRAKWRFLGLRVIFKTGETPLG